MHSTTQCACRREGTQRRAASISAALIVTGLALLGVSVLGAGIVTPAQAQQDISDWHDLANVSQDLDGEYVLTNDLNETTAGFASVASETANGGNGFRPIGTSGDEFTGTLDGQSYAISNFTIYRVGENGVGLFGHAGNSSGNFTIQNLDVRSATVNGGVTSSNTSDGKVGALVGDARNGTIRNVTVSGAVSSPVGDIGAGWGGVGGAVGRHISVTTRDSYANVTLNAPDARNVGGFAGVVRGGRITRSAATGPVTGRNNVGGFGGLLRAYAGSYATVSQSYATGDVTSINSSGKNGTGGFVGTLDGGIIDTAYAIGNVVSDGNMATVYTGTGGFVGYIAPGNDDLTVTKTYASGAVQPGATTGGGLIGTTNNGIISTVPHNLTTESYWDIVRTGQTSAWGGGDGCDCYALTGFDTNDGMGRAAEMTGGDAPGNMTLFDFNTTWETVTNPDDYPRLSNSTLDGPSRDTRSNIRISDLDIAGQGRHATVVGGSEHTLSVKVTNLDSIQRSVTLTLTVSNGTTEQVSWTLTTADIAPSESILVTFQNITGGLEIAEGVYNVSVETANATLTGSIAVRPDVTGNGLPAMDTTGDSNLDDIDGDGVSNILDVQALFAALDQAVVEDYPMLFDFAEGPSNRVSIFDVQALYATIATV